MVEAEVGVMRGRSHELIQGVQMASRIGEREGNGFRPSTQRNAALPSHRKCLTS